MLTMRRSRLLVLLCGLLVTASTGQIGLVGCAKQPGDASDTSSPASAETDMPFADSVTAVGRPHPRGNAALDSLSQKKLPGLATLSAAQNAALHAVLDTTPDSVLGQSEVEGILARLDSITRAGRLASTLPDTFSVASQISEIELFENENFQGRRIAINANTEAIPDVGWSSLRVNFDGWAVFYSKTGYSGSELRVRGPYAIAKLESIVKKNGPCLFGATTAPPGDWQDEIRGVRRFKPVAKVDDGCGTNCPGLSCGPAR